MMRLELRRACRVLCPGGKAEAEWKVEMAVCAFINLSFLLCAPLLLGIRLEPCFHKCECENTERKDFWEEDRERQGQLEGERMRLAGSWEGRSLNIDEDCYKQFKISATVRFSLVWPDMVQTSCCRGWKNTCVICWYYQYQEVLSAATKNVIIVRLPNIQKLGCI